MWPASRHDGAAGHSVGWKFRPVCAILIPRSGRLALRISIFTARGWRKSGDRRRRRGAIWRNSGAGCAVQAPARAPRPPHTGTTLRAQTASYCRRGPGSPNEEPARAAGPSAFRGPERGRPSPPPPEYETPMKSFGAILPALLAVALASAEAPAQNGPPPGARPGAGAMAPP
jgi:hypothetical protein